MQLDTRLDRYSVKAPSKTPGAISERASGKKRASKWTNASPLNKPPADREKTGQGRRRNPGPGKDPGSILPSRTSGSSSAMYARTGAGPPLTVTLPGRCRRWQRG